jgi:hypothetical protein
MTLIHFMVSWADFMSKAASTFIVDCSFEKSSNNWIG